MKQSQSSRVLIKSENPHFLPMNKIFLQNSKTIIFISIVLLFSLFFLFRLLFVSNSIKAVEINDDEEDTKEANDTQILKVINFNSDNISTIKHLENLNLDNDDVDDEQQREPLNFSYIINKELSENTEILSGLGNSINKICFSYLVSSIILESQENSAKNLRNILFVREKSEEIKQIHLYTYFLDKENKIHLYEINKQKYEYGLNNDNNFFVSFKNGLFFEKIWIKFLFKNNKFNHTCFTDIVLS